VMSSLNDIDDRIQKTCSYLDKYLEKLDEKDQNVIKFKNSLQWFVDNRKYVVRIDVQRPDLGAGAWVNGFVNKGGICMYTILEKTRGGSHEQDPFYLIQQITSDDKDMLTTIRTLSSYMDSFWTLCTIKHTDLLYTLKSKVNPQAVQVSQHFNCLLAKLKNESS